MALDFSNALGHWFNIAGKCALLLSQERTNQAAQQTNLISQTVGLLVQLGAESDIQSLVGSGYVGALNAGPDSVGSLAGAVARAALNRLVYRDVPRAGQTLTSDQTVACAYELVRQMKVQGVSVLAQTIAATAGAWASNVGLAPGNGVINTSVRRPLDGLVLEHALAEELLLTVVSDSFVGGSAAGNELIAVQGEGLQGDYYAFDWPGGSGVDLNVSVIDGDEDNSAGNLLTNSGFTEFTEANQADNWEYVVGTAGTHFFEETSNTYGATGSALRLRGNGSTLHQFRQQFDNSADGTGGELEPLSQYSACAFLRRDGTAPASGLLAWRLTDSTGTVVNDAAGVPQTGTINLTALTTNYEGYTIDFRTPLVLPSALYLDFAMVTGNALTSGRDVYIDKVSLGGMSQTIRNGIYIAFHAGSTPFRLADYARVTVTNSRGTAGTLNTFQTAIPRLIPEFYDNEILLPSAAVPSHPDATYIA